MHIVTEKRLNRALFQVQTELEKLNFLDEHMQAVDVYLVPFGNAYGWHYYGSSGDIHIPAISLSRLSDLLGRTYTSLRDVLRHEYAHALADTHRGLFRSPRFTEAFGAPHDARVEWEYDPAFHLSDYAATSPCEDFAETFMFYVRHGGVLPLPLRIPAIRRKWSFLHALRGAISMRIRRWR